MALPESGLSDHQSKTARWRVWRYSGPKEPASLAQEHLSMQGACPLPGEFFLRRPEGAAAIAVFQRERRCPMPRLLDRCPQAPWPHDDRDNPMLALRRMPSRTRSRQARRRQGNCALTLPWCCPLELSSASLLHAEAGFEFGENLFLLAGNLPHAKESTGSLRGLAHIAQQLLFERLPLRR